jgi:hypothetical protein
MVEHFIKERRNINCDEVVGTNFCEAVAHIDLRRMVAIGGERVASV